MATKKSTSSSSTNPNVDTTDEETEPEYFTRENQEEREAAGLDTSGIPGQIVYPDREVDAERAAAFAAGKVDNLDPRADDDPAYESGWENPADRPTEVQTDEDTSSSTSKDSKANE